MYQDKLIIFFENLSKDDVAIAGGKGASLSEMINAGIPIPKGFVVTTKVYHQFASSKPSEEFVSELLASFDSLGFSRVAVRSSAIAEDSADASWAGQFESFLNVDRDGLSEAVCKCWDSAKTDLVLSYARDNNIDESKLALAVVVMGMVDSDTSGVMFTKNPVTNSYEEIMIEACLGLGEMLVQGIITPDNYIVNKIDFSIKTKYVGTQNLRMIFKDGQNTEEAIEAPKSDMQKLRDEQIVEIARLGVLVEAHYGTPQDIEWAINNDKCFIIQSRPITT